MKFILIFILSFVLSQIPSTRVVAEWEPAIGTMIRWPLGIPSELVVELAQDDTLFVLVENSNQEIQARANFNDWGIDLDNIVFIFTETYSHWTRDYGPKFLIDEGEWKVVNQQFNGYPEENGCETIVELPNHNQGRPSYFDSRWYDEDDDTNIDFANQQNWDIFNLPLYWTGGNFMTDGYGMGFSTELMINENNISQSQFLDFMDQYLNVDNYHIFENPNFLSIQHIDCMAKLVNPETIIIKQVSETSPEYECIESFADSFSQLNTFYGRPFKIFRIYCPEINGAWWEVNPVAAYTNSLILNNKVLVPQYGISEDQLALQTFQDAMPGYDVLGFDNNTNSPWYGEDALHCRTIGIFDSNMIHISHKSIREEDIENNSNIYIEVEVLDYGLMNQELSSVFLNWKYEDEDGSFEEIELSSVSNNLFSGFFPQLNSSSPIQYFIKAVNMNGKFATHPNAGWHIFNTLESITGDVNQDFDINIQDVILVINMILDGNFNALGDMNNDNSIDVLDVVQIVNIILNQ
tara:strand:- start:162 stop:1724 length:1563 start_codon:yes stop_codon:yes gene_type:complete